MIDMSRVPTIAAFLAVCPILLQAQVPPSVTLDSGSLVRVHLSTARSIRGRLVTDLSPSNPTLTYCPYPSPPCTTLLDARVRSLPLTQVTGLEVAEGNHWKNGAMIGGLVGLGIGVLVAGEAPGLCDSSACRRTAWRLGLIPFGFGLGLGMAFGSASIKWRPLW